jgi:hypothetical protein
MKAEKKTKDKKNTVYIKELEEKIGRVEENVAKVVCLPLLNYIVE